MLKVDQYSYIRTAHRVYGKKVKQIAKETGHSKNTIKKVLRGEYSGYKPRIEQPYPVLGPYLNIIDQWLEDDIDIAIHEAETFKEYEKLNTDARRNAFIEMIFQMGAPRVRQFTRTLDAIARSDWDEAAREMLRSKWATQTPVRSQELAKLMQSGKYD